MESNIGCYLEKPSTFCKEKYHLLNDFSYTKFLAYYKPEKKKTCEYKLDKLDESRIEKSHKECSYPKAIKLMISGETMRCHKVRQILLLRISRATYKTSCATFILSV